MDAKDKDLLIEIHVTAEDSQKRNLTEKNFTGYPVAPNRILTARHGLLPNVPSSQKTIEVRWHELVPGDSRRSWQPAAIIWEDDGLDAALLECTFPEGLEGFGWLSDDQPRETNPPMRWASAGIARAGDKDAATSGSFDFHGNVYSAASNKPRFAIGVEDEASAAAYWQGSSGMPIFVNHRIIGVAMSCDEATEARRFKASPVWKMLLDRRFREALSYDEREKRRNNAREGLVDLLVGSDPVMKAIGKVLHVPHQAPESWAETLAEKLLNTEIGEAIRAIYRAREQLGRHCRSADREAVIEVLGLILPVVYDEGVINCARTRCTMPGTVLLELPVGIETVAEVIMAGVRARPALFRPLRDRNQFPTGLFALAEPPDEGFDSDGTVYEHNMHAHLCNRLLAGEEEDFEGFMVDFLLGKDATDYRKRGVKKDDLIKMAQDELEARAEYRKAYYYFIVRLPPSEHTFPHLEVAIEQLKSCYRQLDFVVLAHAGDGMVIRSERERFRPLLEILPGTTERSA
jgi:hypothetical protein